MFNVCMKSVNEFYIQTGPNGWAFVYEITWLVVELTPAAVT